MKGVVFNLLEELVRCDVVLPKPLTRAAQRAALEAVTRGRTTAPE
jgi:hypothetical protein